MKGYIKLFRQIVDSDIWKLKPFSEGQAWIDLLCITNFEKGFIKTKNGQIITLNRGDCGYSMLTLSERWGWSRGKTKRFLDFLTEQQMIQQKMCGKHTVLLISNFEKYQIRTTNDTTNDTTNGQQTDTIKKNKEEKEEKEKEILKNFNEFYLKYPLKKAKDKAFLSYKKAILAAEPSAIMEGLDRYIDDIRTKKTEPRFIKYPSTWLNQGCWKDEYDSCIDYSDPMFHNSRL